MRPERVTTESPINSGVSADQRAEGSHQRMVRLEQLKAELNERRLTEIAAMLDDVGVPEGVENNFHRGVPSNSAVMRLKWYLARRKDVKPGEIDQRLQRDMNKWLLCVKRHSNESSSATAGKAGVERKGES